MALQLLTAPAQEPVSLAEAKAHIRVTDGGEDALINSLITTSRLQIEAGLGLALITQDWRLVLDCWPLGDTLEVPLRPLASVSEIRVYDNDANASIVDPLGYTVDTASMVPRIASRSGYWPIPGARTNGIEIDFIAGYGANADTVPAPIRQAMLLLVGHWYEHRETASSATLSASIPDRVSKLLQPYVVPQL
jgi:uncharacterized phiE125 gp8 family phage protein